MRTVAVLAGGVLALASCTYRDPPYRFRAPVVSAVRADPLPTQTLARSVTASSPTATAVARARTRPRGFAPRDRPDRERPSVTTGRDLNAFFKDLEGTQYPHLNDIQFVWSLLDTVGAVLDPRVRQLQTTADLWTTARARDAVYVDQAPLTGDLAVIVSGANADLAAAIVVAVRGTTTGRHVEFMYLDDHAVRRGVATWKHRSAGAFWTIDQTNCRQRQHAVLCRAGVRLRAFLHLDRLSP